tara:strand:- start:548 stop:736 length:189 start_codon:yes stop_codon:yes gene_type:complete
MATKIAMLFLLWVPGGSKLDKAINGSFVDYFRRISTSTISSILLVVSVCRGLPTLVGDGVYK